MSLFSIVRHMKKIITFAFLFVLVSTNSVAENSVEEIFNQLVLVCKQHPEYRASSVDFYNPETAKKHDKLFHEKAKSLRSKVTMMYFMPKRKEAKQKEEITCIDNILNTWPG